MAAKKTELMAQFYEQCQKKGYTDMQDEVQSLKAKVIAVDLGLNYKDITVFYEKAKECYRQVQEERAEAEKQRKIREQEEQAEAARRAVDGTLLVTVCGAKNKQLSVYLRPDHTRYTEKDGLRIEGIPTFTVEQGGSLHYTYNPSKLVYTGATSGNITMGGVHQTEASYSEKVVKSEKGYIEAELQGTKFTVLEIIMSELTQQKFHRDRDFNRLVSNGKIQCTKYSEMANWMTQSALSGTGGLYSQVSTLTMAADEKRLSYEECAEIAGLLRRVAYGHFPPSDEEIYERAAKLAKGSTSAELNSAIEQFRKISDFRDSSQQIQRLQDRCEEVLQREKEQAVLKKEATAKKRKKLLKLAAPVVCAIAILIYILVSVIIPSVKYNDAVSLLNNGQYKEAIAAFEALDGYKDSAQKVAEIYEQYKQEQLRSANVGDYILFGSYEQDNVTAGKEKIEWLVLNKYEYDNSVLVISKYALDCRPYHTSDTDISWKYCSLREWLNNDFMDAAFSVDEKAIIQTVTVKAHKNPKSITNHESDTEDKVFLLSVLEADKYFGSDDARMCQPTAYADANGVYVDGGHMNRSHQGNCIWWLRSPGYDQESATTVSYSGAIWGSGSDVDAAGIAVRPALWIDLDMIE